MTMRTGTELVYPPLNWRYKDVDGVRWWNRSDVAGCLGGDLGLSPIWMLEGDEDNLYITTSDLIAYLIDERPLAIGLILADALDPLLNRDPFDAIDWDTLQVAPPESPTTLTDLHFTRWLSSPDPLDWLTL